MTDRARRCGASIFAWATLALAGTSASAANWNVDVGGAGFAFTPATLTVTAGDTVTFTNRGGFHNVVADDGSFRCAQGCAAGAGDPDSTLWSSTVTLASPGTVGYHCEVHGAAQQGMFGTIVVDPAPPPPNQQSPVDGVPGGSAVAYWLLAAALILVAGRGAQRRTRKRR